MHELIVKRLEPKNEIEDLSSVARLLDKKAAVQKIDTLNWKAFSYRPEITFKIGHTSKEVLLKFQVNEKYIRAVETRTNGDVYKDSCVEFFLSFDKTNYYNFEFNCIGTIHLAYGPDRDNRKFVAPEIVREIEVESSLGAEPFNEKSGNFKWELVVRIPLKCFAFSDIQSLDNQAATANFYKCGDETTLPHYLTWNPIETAAPDYHQPEFFGKIRFE